MNENIACHNNEIQAAIDAGSGLGKLQFITGPSGAPLALVPSGYTAKVIPVAEVESWMPKPFRKKGAFIFTTIESFNRYVNEHKSKYTRIFATITPTEATFKAILNFHGGVETESSFNDHLCTVKMQTTPEWDLWLRNNKAKMTQVEFAAFLEENPSLFVSPAGAELLELVQTLEGHSNAKINSAVKLQNGTIKLSYDEDVVLKGSGGAATNKTGDMTIPALLNVGIAPFTGCPKFSITARLRYRVQNRELSFFYETVDLPNIIPGVCQGILELIKEKTEIEPFMS